MSHTVSSVDACDTYTASSVHVLVAVTPGFGGLELANVLYSTKEFHEIEENVHLLKINQQRFINKEERSESMKLAPYQTRISKHFYSQF